MYVIGSEDKPIKIWADDIEPGAMTQARNLANLPFTFKHIALMPDVHQGYGMPIGGVMATKGIVVPNAVGVDIGCGMCALRTPFTTTEIDTGTIKYIMGGIRSDIPVGFNHHKEKQIIPAYLIEKFPDFDGVVHNQWESARYQIGTLGGGNHFIEIQKDVDKNIWIMIHSGSRNLGKRVADFYNNKAVMLNKRWHTVVNPKWDLSFLPIEEQDAKQYLEEMNFCVAFASSNRIRMMEKIVRNMEIITGQEIPMNSILNIAHNYAKYEHHFGENVLVHRKGATSAINHQIGIIPGSQGSNSYIVTGMGNVDSFMSCSHGAGRRMGRADAKRRLDLVEEQQLLDMKGIIHSLRVNDDLDEAPGAYKDIKNVMFQQKDLVQPMIELTPLAVVKG